MSAEPRTSQRPPASCSPTARTRRCATGSSRCASRPARRSTRTRSAASSTWAARRCARRSSASRSRTSSRCSRAAGRSRRRSTSPTSRTSPTCACSSRATPPTARRERLTAAQRAELEALLAAHRRAAGGPRDELMELDAEIHRFVHRCAGEPVPRGDARALLQPVAAHLVPRPRPPAAPDRARARAPRAARGDPRRRGRPRARHRRRATSARSRPRSAASSRPDGPGRRPGSARCRGG